jgi:hypothetical protein
MATMDEFASLAYAQDINYHLAFNSSNFFAFDSNFLSSGSDLNVCVRHLIAPRKHKRMAFGLRLVWRPALLPVLENISTRHNNTHLIYCLRSRQASARYMAVVTSCRAPGRVVRSEAQLMSVDPQLCP